VAWQSIYAFMVTIDNMKTKHQAGAFIIVLVVLTAGCSGTSTLDTPRNQTQEEVQTDTPNQTEADTNADRYLNRSLPTGPIELRARNSDNKSHNITIEISNQTVTEVHEFDVAPTSVQSVSDGITNPTKDVKRYNITVFVDSDRVKSKRVAVNRSILSITVDVKESDSAEITLIVN